MNRLEKSYGKLFEFDNSFIFNPYRLGNIDLYQIGELNCEAGFQISSHLQLCHEISYIVSGKGKFITDARETEVKKGDIYLNAKGHIHSIEADRSSSLRFLYLGFNFNHIGDTESELLLRFFETFENPLAKDENGLASQFAQAVNEFYGEDAFSSYMRSSRVKQVIIQTYRNFVGVLPEPGHSDSFGSVGFTAYQIVKYVDEHIETIDKIEDIARQLGYSYGYVSHVFSKKAGISLNRYINLKKTDEAIKLMKEGKLTVTQISEKLNYKSIQSFSKVFKRMTGVCPNQFLTEKDRKTEASR